MGDTLPPFDITEFITAQKKLEDANANLERRVFDVLKK